MVDKCAFSRFGSLIGIEAMTTQAFKRKLTAILSADVKGYRRLIGEEEEATVRTLTALWDVMTNLCALCFWSHEEGRIHPGHRRGGVSET